MFRHWKARQYKRQLRSEWAFERKAAVELLCKLGSRHALRALISALKDRESDVRSEAAHCLGELGDRRAVQPLIDTLGSSTMRSAALALGKLGDKKAVLPLVKALKESCYDREASIIADALDALGWEPADDAERAILAVVRCEWTRCVELGPAAFEPLAKALAGQKYGEFHIVDALVSLNDPRAVDLLVSELSSHKDPWQLERRGDAGYDPFTLQRQKRREACGPALTRLMRNVASRMTLGQLEAVVALPPVCTWYYEAASKWNSCGNAVEYKKESYTSDTAEARQLARQELIRRQERKEVSSTAQETPSPIMVACACGGKYLVKPEYAGKTVRCKQCDRLLAVPSEGK